MSPAPDQPRVLAICGDPGGARALLPVLQRLSADGRVALTCAAYRQGHAILTTAGFAPATLPGDSADPVIARRLLDAKPALLLTATSVNGTDWEKIFVTEARARGIASLGLLDFWSNYAPRFSRRAGALDALPDRIAVMDERAARELAAAGAPAPSLVITGQPAFDGLAAKRQAFTAADRARVRAGLGAGENERLVLFASQPFREFARSGVPSPGFDEASVLDAVLATLRGLPPPPRPPVVLAVRLHPREPADAFAPATGNGWRMLVRRDGDSHELALAADLVVGMNSILLMEACYLGCAVLSLQPGLRGPDALPTNAWGASAAVFESREIPAMLARMIFDDNARRDLVARAAALKAPASAARQVAELLYSMLPASVP